MQAQWFPTEYQSTANGIIVTSPYIGTVGTMTYTQIHMVNG